MRDFEIADPWQVRVRERLLKTFVCAPFGHKRPKAFKGGLKACRRCGG